MMFRINILLLLILSGFCQAQTTGQVHWVEGKKYVSYKVQPKDTWTALAGRYSIGMKDLQKVNDGVIALKIGQTIYVPADKTAAITAIAENKPAQTTKNLTHVVQKGETLYRISKMYNTTVADIKKWNNLTTDNVPLGKTLIVGKGDTKIATSPKETPVVKSETTIMPVNPPLEEKKTEEKPVVKSEEKPVIKSEEKPIVKTEEKKEVQETKAPAVEETVPSKTQTSSKETFAEGTVEKITETGVATWLNDQELNPNKFYALHRTAPIGTIVKVTNRMTNNSVFVKVVGLLPDTGDNSGIIIKITQAAAQRIGAIDQKFTAELSYGITH